MKPLDHRKEAAFRNMAIRLIATKGIEALNMKELADRCGYSPSTIYVYYKSKDDLLIEVSKWLRLDSLESSIKGLRPGMSLQEGLLLQWENRFQYCMKHPHRYKAGEKLKYTPYYLKSTPEVVRSIGPELGNFLEHVTDKGELQKMDFELYWAIAFAPLYQLIEFHLIQNSFANTPFQLTEQKIKDTVKMVARALAPES